MLDTYRSYAENETRIDALCRDDKSYGSEGCLLPSGGGLGDTIISVDSLLGFESLQIGFPDLTEDINHLQLVSGDSVAYVSSRLTSSVFKVNVTTREVVWIAGGANGFFSVSHLDGERFAPGECSFFEQYNAELFGDHELFLVDN